MLTKVLVTLLLINDALCASPMRPYWDDEILEDWDMWSESYTESCTDGQSKIYADSLSAIIDDQIANKQVVEKVTSFCQIQAVYDKHMFDLQEFLTLFENRPYHLKHVLQSMNQTRVRIEPQFQKLVLDLKNYPLLEKSNDMLRLKLEEIEKKYEAVTTICEFNCDSADYVITRKGSIQGSQDYVCGFYSDMKKIINKELDKFMESAEATCSYLIRNYDEEYEQIINDFKKSLKQRALQEFGLTMYDILSLVDEYYHFVQLLEGDTNELITVLNATMEKNEKNINELTTNLNTLRWQCNECYKPATTEEAVFYERYRFNRKIFAESSISDNLLLNIVLNKTMDITRDLSTKLCTTFAPLDLQLNFGPKNDYINNLKPLQDEITKITKEERNQLNVLKYSLTNSNIDKLAVLKELSQKLATNIIELNDKVVLDIAKNDRKIVK